ncbi:hypothetical protein TorRG33x02_304400 [Trema orientale]|uniref:Uncharacterized protein n=1 Tax=Trema orientale TaxID=63057 RepID=A0A2P5BY76_TREOI|nr:hypothetical protein TorRG33x02_304400 [Trema orientale]
MEQADRTRVQRPAAPPDIVPAEAVLVPAVVNGLHVPGEDQQERRQRTQIVNPLLPLHLHPVLDPFPVIAFPPPHQIHDHHPRVEVAGPPRPEHPGQDRVGPEPVREVLGEVGVAVLRGPDDACPRQGRAPELVDVVDDDHVGVKVNDPVNAGIEDVAEVVPGVVQRVLQGLADRGRDEVDDRVLPEDVDLEPERRERGSDELTQDAGARPVELGRDEVEEDVVGARGVLQDGVYGGYGSPEVLPVQSHGHVDQRRVTRRGHSLAEAEADDAAVGSGAVGSVAVLRSLGEPEQPIWRPELGAVHRRERPNPEAKRRREE